MRGVLGLDELNERIAYHGHVLVELARRRTNLTSGLVPVREYMAVSNHEAWSRWPAIMRTVDATVPAEELGRRFRRPGQEVGSAYFWALANIPLTGRLVHAALDTVGDDEAERLSTCFDFWERTATAWRGDGFRQCWDAGDVCRPWPAEVVGEVAAGAVGVGERAGEVRRFLAGVMQYLFLMFMDSRMGTADSGPYPLPDGRTLIVREFWGMSRSWLPWSEVAGDVPCRKLTCGLVFRPGLQAHVIDFQTLVSTPVDNLEWLEAVSVFETGDDGSLRPLALGDLPAISDAVRVAQRALYREVAGWTFEEKVLAGAYLYFCGLIRPWTVAAGVVDDVDWSIAKDHPLLPLLQFMPQDDAVGGDTPIFPPIAGAGGAG